MAVSDPSSRRNVRGYKTSEGQLTAFGNLVIAFVTLGTLLHWWGPVNDQNLQVAVALGGPIALAVLNGIYAWARARVKSVGL